MQVKIDHREIKLKELIRQDKIECTIEYENLVHGDIMLYYNDKPLYVFERKTLADLRASINDGRYINQKINMLNQYDSGRIYYIIEGDSHIQDEALTGALINTMLRDKIGIFKTNHIHATVQLLYDIVHRVKNNPHKYMHVHVPTQELQPSVINRKESLFVNMLCQIPHISTKTARAIQEKYKCFNDLHQILQNKPQHERIETLREITVVDKRGNGRRISSTACDNIIRACYGERETK
jgi:ERCC4-type nuclease